MPTEDSSQRIAGNANDPKTVVGDKGTVTVHDIDKQILADRYARSTAATRRGTGLGLKVIQAIPPGASGVPARDC